MTMLSFIDKLPDITKLQLIAQSHPPTTRPRCYPYSEEGQRVRVRLIPLTVCLFDKPTYPQDITHQATMV